MVDNPQHHPDGDFALDTVGNVVNIDVATAHEGKTFSGLASFDKSLFNKLQSGIRPLRPVLETAIAEHQLSGEIHSGLWSDIGTLQRLNQARHSRQVKQYIDSVKRSMS
jgi:MurNAc alpha-1-phosphate uridylyltransferase